MTTTIFQTQKVFKSLIENTCEGFNQLVNGLHSVGTILVGGYRPTLKTAPQKSETFCIYRGPLDHTQSFHF